MTIYTTVKDRVPYTYLIGWSKLNIWYYGSRYGKGCKPADLWVKYFTSSNTVKKFRREYGEPDIIQVRKQFSTIEHCRLFEARVLRWFQVPQNPMWLNVSYGDDKWYFGPPKCGELNPFFGKKHTPKTIEHLKAIKQANPRVGVNNPFYGKHHTEEQREKWSRDRTGRKQSPDAIAKVKEKLQGRKQTDEHRRKNSEANKGHHRGKGVPKSEEWKRKMRQPKPKVVSRVFDRKEMDMGSYVSWVRRS